METVVKISWANTGNAMRGKDRSHNTFKFEPYQKAETFSLVHIDFPLRNAKCGKIQCQSSATKPTETNAVAIDTTVALDGNRKLLCRGTHVYKSNQGDDNQGDTLDPGLVMTGTKCGENAVSILIVLIF